MVKPVNTLLTHPSSEHPRATQTAPDRSDPRDVIRRQGHKRGRTNSSLNAPPTSEASQPADDQAAPAGATRPLQKRRRRAPSPSRWIPNSLSSFNLTSEEHHKAAPVPLPPRYPEEASLDENDSVYHPKVWNRKQNPVLPGPAGIGMGYSYRGNDNRNWPAGGGCMGRLVLAI